MGILIRIVLNLQIAFGCMAILTILIPLIQEHGIYFVFFESSSVFFINVSQFLTYRSPWRSLFLGIFLDAVLNGIAFLLFSGILLLVNRNEIDVCILINYPVTLLKSFISSNGFCVETLEFSMQYIMLSANSDRLASFCPIWVYFIPFSCLIAVARISNSMLK